MRYKYPYRTLDQFLETNSRYAMLMESLTAIRPEQVIDATRPLLKQGDLLCPSTRNC